MDLGCSIREVVRMSTKNACIEVSRSEYAKTRLVEEPRSDLAPGQVRFRIDRFALTANNVTYAVVGDMLGYWDFFPAEKGWGRIPCMGWAEVIESNHPDVAVGGRYYGWYPLARTIDMTVTPIDQGLRDDGEHRTAHAAPYRTYMVSERDPFYQPGDDGEGRQTLLRGVFITGFLADDFFAGNDYFGAKHAIVLSASSKTAISYATSARKQGLESITGVTSAGNLDFCKELGCYDRLVTYDDLSGLPESGDAVIVDMAGNAEVLEKVHVALGERLKYSMMIGMSHHDSDRDSAPSVGPAPELFFAPSQMEKRMKDWGPDGYRDRLSEAVASFADGSRKWLEVKHLNGTTAALGAWDALIQGKVRPNIGQVVSLWDDAD
jgi:hypothetical protein